MGITILYRVIQWHLFVVPENPNILLWIGLINHLIFNLNVDFQNWFVIKLITVYNYIH